MIRFLSILLIIGATSACETMNNASFSKRKHMKGHFWNLKEKYKQSNSTGDQKDLEVAKKNNKKNQSWQRTNSISVLKIDELEPTSEYVEHQKIESTPQSIEKPEENIALSNASNEDELEINEEKEKTNNKKNKAPSDLAVSFAVIVLILLGLLFWAGVIGLIVSLFMHVFSAIIPWVFYSSLIVVGVPVLALIVFLIVVSIQEKRKQTPNPPHMEVANWQNNGHELVREFSFKNQTELAEFVLDVARYSDEVNHHADMQISQCRKLRVTISTHDQNGLTELDYQWAEGVNACIK